MLRFAVVALLPELVEPVTRFGVVGRAFERGLVTMACFNPREQASDRHRTVDDRPYGGGPGMVLKYAPMAAAIDAALRVLPEGSPRLVMAAHGRRFDQAQAARLAQGPGALLVTGRYEGLDERLVEAYGLEAVSLGDYVLSGGELAAAAIVDATCRLLPGALGDEDSAQQDSFAGALLDWPHYTRPDEIAGRRVPQVLLEGDHEAIRRWRHEQALARTRRWRPELLEEATRATTVGRKVNGNQGPAGPVDGEDDEQSD